MNCDHCGKTVNPNAKFCGKCGAFLNLVKKAQAQSEQPKPPTESSEPTHATLELEKEQNVNVQQVSEPEVQVHESAQLNDEQQGANSAVPEVDSQSLANSVHTPLGELSHGVASTETTVDEQVSALPIGEDHTQAHVEHHAQEPSADSFNPLESTALTPAAQNDCENHVHSESSEQNLHNASQSSVEQGEAPLMNPPNVQSEVTFEAANTVQTVLGESVQEVHSNEPLVHETHGVSESTHATSEPSAQGMISPPTQQDEVVNIERMAPVLDNPIPSMGAEFAQMLDSMSQSLSAMRLEMDQKVAEIKADAHATAQALAQRIYITQQANQAPDLSALNAQMEQIKSDLSSSMGQLKEHQSATAQALVIKNADDMQAIMAAEFKKIQTGIVNLYNTQQNTVVQTNANFEQALDGLTFKIQNIENFVNSQLSAQAQAQANAVAANKSIGTSINEIRTQLQEQQELLSGLTIDPALIKTMNSFNINFRKQQEMMAAQAQKGAAEAQSKKSEGVSISDTVVMWFIGFLCGLTVLLGGLSIYNYSSAQSLKSQIHKQAEDSEKVSEQAPQAHEDEGAHKAEKAVSSNVPAHPESEGANAEKKAESAEKPDMKTMRKESDKALEKTSEKTNEKANDHSVDKGGEKAADHHSEKESAKKHGSSEKE